MDAQWPLLGARRSTHECRLVADSSHSKQRRDLGPGSADAQGEGAAWNEMVAGAGFELVCGPLCVVGRGSGGVSCDVPQLPGEARLR